MATLRVLCLALIATVLQQAQSSQCTNECHPCACFNKTITGSMPGVYVFADCSNIHINETVFSQLPSDIEELDVSNSNATSFPGILFRHLPHLKSLILQNTNIAYLCDCPADYPQTSMLQRLDLRGNPLDITEIQPCRKFFEHVSDLILEADSLDENSLVPFPAVKNLRLKINSADVPGKLFQSQTMMESIHLDLPLVESLPDELFTMERAEKLTKLTVNAPNLIIPDRALLMGLEKLNELRLELQNENVPEDLIYINESCLESGEKRYFLRQIVIDGVEHLPEDVFKCAPYLRNVQISRSSVLPERIFNASHGIKNLTLTANNFTSVPFKLLKYIKKLHYLNLSHNLIEQILTDDLSHASHLKILDLSFNKIKNISENAFEPVSDTLRYLKLDGNPVCLADQNNIFPCLNSLETLHCESSCIFNITDAFCEIQTLQVLYLTVDGTRLEDAVELFSCLPNLCRFYFNDMFLIRDDSKIFQVESSKACDSEMLSWTRIGRSRGDTDETRCVSVDRLNIDDQFNIPSCVVQPTTTFPSHLLSTDSQETDPAQAVTTVHEDFPTTTQQDHSGPYDQVTASLPDAPSYTGSAAFPDDPSYTESGQLVNTYQATNLDSETTAVYAVTGPQETNPEISSDNQTSSSVLDATTPSAEIGETTLDIAVNQSESELPAVTPTMDVQGSTENMLWTTENQVTDDVEIGMTTRSESSSISKQFTTTVYKRTATSVPTEIPGETNLMATETTETAKDTKLTTTESMINTPAASLTQTETLEETKPPSTGKPEPMMLATTVSKPKQTFADNEGMETSREDILAETTSVMAGTPIMTTKSVPSPKSTTLDAEIPKYAEKPETTSVTAATTPKPTTTVMAKETTKEGGKSPLDMRSQTTHIPAPTVTPSGMPHPVDILRIVLPISFLILLITLISLIYPILKGRKKRAKRGKDWIEREQRRMPSYDPLSPYPASSLMFKNTPLPLQYSPYNNSQYKSPYKTPLFYNGRDLEECSSA